MQGDASARDATADELRARIAALESELAAERARAAALQAERDKLRDAYRQLQLEVELLRRRIFVAKAERVDTRQLELEFASKKKELDALARKLGVEPAPPPPADQADPAGPRRRRAKPKGRRNLATADLPVERHELLDPELEGKLERIGFEETSQIGWRKGGPVNLVIARAKYRSEAGDGVVTTAMPKRTFPRLLAAPSLLAKIAVDKFADGLPLFRQEQRFAREGLTLDRGTMSRWLEDLGMTVGAVVMAMRDEAMQTAFCISTDATGVAVQPEPSADKGRRPCRRGHFFVMLADRDHIFFEYTPRETSASVAEMFRGYSGYLQADAKSVYDVLFTDPATRDDDDDDGHRSEVGCWAHARRRFYEAAIAKDKVAREALYRIQRIFDHERSWVDSPPLLRAELRRRHIAPEVDALFEWADLRYAEVKAQRGLLRSAFGYVVRQREALRRFLDDGRLRLDNNASERELRQVAVGRKAWLFVGSDDHAQAAANLFSLIASCRLHGLDPEAYLRDLVRVLAQWPADRYLELAPRYWAGTRARLDPAELALPIGKLTVPAKITPPEQQSSQG